MRRIKSCFISTTVLVIFLVTAAISQSPSERQNYLPKVIGSSPETMMMQRFGNYAVNLSSGVPNISIPLFEINTGKLKVPVTLSYHASGVRVRDDATWVGLGWNLSAGGNISRSVRSKADEMLGYLRPDLYTIPAYSSLDPINNSVDLNFSNDVARGIYDVEPDIYSISLPTVNCKFYYANRQVSQPIMIPYTPVKLNSSISGNNLYFNLKDESGIEYVIGNSRESFSSGGPVPENYATAWNLSQMISSDKTDTIFFNYVSNSYSGGGGDYYDIITVTDYVTNTTPGSCGDFGNCSTCQGRTEPTSGGGNNNGIGATALQEIVFPEGKIVFELETVNRQDIPNKNLKSVKIYKKDPYLQSYTLQKSYSFYYSYFVNGTEKRMKLDSLQLKDQTNINIQSYNFTYNQSITMPLKSSMDKDYWGFYNARSNSSRVPVINTELWGPNGGLLITPLTVGTANLSPDPNYNQVGILTKIKFPTGGTTDFTYETNQYYDNPTSTVKYGGGLRIKQMKNTDPVTGNINYKTYKYGVGENGYGSIIIPVTMAHFITEQYYYPAYNMLGVTRRIRTFCSNPNIGLDPFDGNSVGYTEVAEYTGTETVNSGKSVSKFSFTPDVFSYPLLQFNRPTVESHFFQRGQLLEQTDFKKTGASTYQKLRKVNNLYGVFPIGTTPNVALRLFEKNTFQYQQVLVTGSACAGSPPSPYHYATYSLLTGDNRIYTSAETVYDQNDEAKYVTTTTDYFYENAEHKQVTKTRITNSRGEIRETLFKYPGDFTSPQVLVDMKNANMINTIIDKEEKLAGSSMTLIHNEYLQFAPNRFYPTYITSKIKANSPETEVTFNTYDNYGNITRYTGKDGIATNFIWDYNNSNPIAKITNATATDFAYTSFEADAKGNWSFTGTVAVDPTAPTGKKCYNLGTSITKNGLSTSTTYIVSYWKKSGTVAVNGIAPTTGRSVNGWTYYEHKIVNPASGLVTVSGTNGIIDELRLYPAANVQMTTYTYEPLVGMTAQCDPNNRIIYYEYDALQRLMLVRDQDYNILKKICYNYANQPENCNIFYNQQQSGVYTKACSAGSFGSQVTYFVPANVYSASTQAAANQLALDDLTANGQSYANSNGTCTVGITVNGYNGKIGYNYKVVFTNIATGNSYTFNLPQTTTLTYLGVVPTGSTYDVNFQPLGSGTNSTFVLNGVTWSGTTSRLYSGATLSAPTDAHMY